METQQQGRLLKVKEAADRLRLRPNTIRRMAHERRIASVRPTPHTLRIPEQAIEEMLTKGFLPAAK